MKLLFLSFCFLLFLSSWLSPQAIAAPSVTVGPASDSVYVVQGNDFSDASGIDVTVRYDPAALASPQVVQGGLVGGALMAVNVSTAGKIRLALVRVTAINGSGTIATITFIRVKSTGADIQSVVSSAINSSGRNIPITSQVVNSAKLADSGATTQQQTEQSTGGTSPPPVSNTPVTTTPPPVPGTPVATAPIGIAGVVVPSAGASTSDIQSATSATNQTVPNMQQPDNEKTAAQEQAKVALTEKPVVQALEPAKKKVMAYQSVLEKFREYKGKKTPEALMALFSPQAGQLAQEPRIVLADGKTTVKVLLELNPNGENNNFLLDGASLVSLSNKDKNFWIAELLPDKRAYEATVSVPRNNQWYVIPLTTAPAMDVNIDRSANRLTEVDFSLYLKDKGTVKAPRFDLNGDGRRDYIDDFIFTANYIVQRDSSVKRGTKSQK